VELFKDFSTSALLQLDHIGSQTVAPGVNGVIVQALVNSFKEAVQEQALVKAREAGDKSDLRANSKRKSTHLRSDSGSEDESTDNSGKSSDKGI
jgi:hypothetical protein